MPKFIVNKNPQANGDHEVHNTTAGCNHLPDTVNRMDLGFHASCSDAVKSAKNKLPGKRVNGCYYCCEPCHTS